MASRADVGGRRQHQTIVDNRTLAMTGREVVDPLRDLPGAAKMTI
jgi:hypothetical protein